jgi:hypothetical protein
LEKIKTQNLQKQERKRIVKKYGFKQTQKLNILQLLQTSEFMLLAQLFKGSESLIHVWKK